MAQKAIAISKHLSNYNDWEQWYHADEWLMFQENVGERLSTDEITPSQAELYATVSNNKDSTHKAQLSPSTNRHRNKKCIQ